MWVTGKNPERKTGDGANVLQQLQSLIRNTNYRELKKSIN
jgi:hypothetical protein